MQKKQFSQVLVARAREQQKLASTQVLPLWFGPFTRLVAFHAMPSIVLFSFIMSLVLFSLYYSWFATLATYIRS